MTRAGDELEEQVASGDVGQQSSRSDEERDSGGEERDAETPDEEEATAGLTEEDRARGGHHSAQAQERDERGRFVGKD